MGRVNFAWRKRERRQEKVAEGLGKSPSVRTSSSCGKRVADALTLLILAVVLVVLLLRHNVPQAAQDIPKILELLTLQNNSSLLPEAFKLNVSRNLQGSFKVPQFLQDLGVPSEGQIGNLAGSFLSTPSKKGSDQEEASEKELGSFPANSTPEQQLGLPGLLSNTPEHSPTESIQISSNHSATDFPFVKTDGALGPSSANPPGSSQPGNGPVTTFMASTSRPVTSTSRPVNWGGLPDLHVFYHIYAERSLKHQAYRIIREQQTAMRDSGLEASARAIHYHVTGSLWNEVVLQPGGVYKKSPGSNVSGSEIDSLDALWGHCRLNPSDKVLYIHSKGSYHAKSGNELLRRAMMFSLLDPCCATAISSNLSFDKWANISSDHGTFENMGSGPHDVCGMRFAPIPHAHIAGNMWWARCDYIQKLLQPSEFRTRMYDVAAWVYKETPGDSARIGSGRFSAEHWVTSHPSVRVVDSLPQGSSPNKKTFTSGYDNPPYPKSLPWQPVCSAAPRRDISYLDFFLGPDTSSPLLPSQRFSEYQRLYGNDPLTVSDQKGEGRTSTVCMMFEGMYSLLKNEATRRRFKLKKYDLWVKDYEKWSTMLQCKNTD